MTPAAVLDRRRAEERLSLWTDETSVVTSARAATPGREGAAKRLADAVEGACSTLDAGFAVPCLMCGGAMRPRWSAGAGVVGGRCADCGTDLE